MCPNLSLVVECIGIEVNFLEWRRNDVEIEPNFNIGDSPREQSTGPYTLILEAIDVDQMKRVANMTTRLVVNISSLRSGDEITCATFGMSSSEMLNYTLRGTSCYVPCHKLYIIITIVLMLGHTKWIRSGPFSQIQSH